MGRIASSPLRCAVSDIWVMRPVRLMCLREGVLMDRVVLGSTIVFAPYSIDQALEGLAEAGYHACEIGAVKGWFEHIDPDTASDREIDRIAGKLADLGLKPVSLSGPAQLQTE